MQDGSLNIYSPTGRRYLLLDICLFKSLMFDVFARLMPPLSLGSPCSFMHGTKYALMVITSNGQLFSWYVNYAVLMLAIQVVMHAKPQERQKANMPLPSPKRSSPAHLKPQLHHRNRHRPSERQPRCPDL
jgi:hypothetical protein